MTNTSPSVAVSDELHEIGALAVGAGKILLDHMSSERMDTRAKGDRDVVTAADLASEQFIIDWLRRNFPDDGIIGEEGSQTISRSGRRWAVDPLDGTLNYSRGLPIWCVSISCFEADEPILGVVYDPLREEVFSAARGLGAWLNGEPISPRPTANVADAYVHVTVDFKDAGVQIGLEDMLAVAPRVLRTRNLGSAALSLAYVACGRLDAVLHRFAYVWDYGAGACLVREAGGHISSMDGAPYTFECQSIVAAGTQPVHAGLIDTLKTVEESRVQ